MPIINKGKLTLSEVVQRQVNQDWPSANTDYDLYVQDLIASGNVVANGLIIRNIEVSDNILTGNVVASTITANTLTLDIITANTFVGIDTDQVTEGSANLYFTNTRAVAALQGQDVTLNDVTISGDLVVQGNTVTLNTATLTVEDKNILIANGAANALLADGAGITIDGAQANITYEAAEDRFVINKELLVQDNVTILGELSITGNITGNGLTIRGIEVSDAVLTGNISAAGLSGNTIVVDIITANVWNNIYTANVTESASNLYFTTDRARASFTAGDNITIVNGRISAIQNLNVINDSTTIQSEANTLTYSMGRTISDSRNILVIIEGLIQIPSTDYSVNGQQLIFVDQPPVGTNIEVRFFGVESSTGSTPSLVSAVNSFTGNGANVIYELTLTPPGKDYITVIIDGVTQLDEAYSLLGNQLTFSSAPEDGSSIDVRIISGKVSSGFTTRNFTGDGTSNNYTISTGYDENTILVFENGVAQVPGTDYSVVNGNVVFATAPAANVGIQIRELGTNGANLLNTIEGLNQRTGNLVPSVDNYFSIGSADYRYKNLFLTGNTIVLGDIALSSFDGLLKVSPVVEGNIITANAAPASLTGGNNITIEANGRISTTNTLALSSVTNLAGNTAITVASSGQATFAAPVSQPGAFMFRNKLINGNFDIWQRGTSQTTSGYGSADRWQNLHNGSTKTASQQAFALGQTDVPNNPKYFMRHVVSSVAGAGNYVFVTQKIEGVETLSGKTATLSFWAKADANKNMAVEFVQYFGSGGSPSDVVTGIGSQLVALTTSWTKYTITVDIPSVSGKTKGTNDNDILQVFFWFDAGSDFDVRTINLGQQSGTFDIAQVQLEEGSAATPFEQRFYNMEFLLCQRYCQTIGARFTGSVENATYFAVFFPTLIDMRTNPSASIRSGHYFSARYNGTDVNIINPTLAATSALRNGVWALVASSGLVTYRPIQPRMQQNLLNDFILLNAEL